MKNKYLSAFGFLSALAFSGFSQITITKTDFISKGDTIRMSQALTAGIPDPTLSGANYTWDYSKLVPTVQYLDTFVDVANTPFLYQLFFNNSFFFPNNKATIAHKVADFTALTQIQMTNTFNFYQNINSGYSMVGFGTTINGLGAPTKYDSIDVIYKYPVKYLNKDSSISKFVDSIPGIGYYGQHKKRVNHIEGWGTLKTPYGTFPALKVKSTLYVTDTIYYNNIGFGFKFPRPVSYEYKWLANGKKVPLLEIDATGTNVTAIYYRDSLRAGVAHLGINEMSNSADFSVYPNPSNGRIVLTYTMAESGAVKLDLIDVYGKLVRIFVEEKQPGGMYTNTFNLTASDVARGIYFARLTINGTSTIRKLLVE